MKTRTKLLSGLALLSSAGLSMSAFAGCPAPITLPTSTASNSVTFGDGISYSLPVLGLSVQSSPGQIDDCIVLATGASGQNLNTNIAGTDNAYAMPSGTGGSPFFRTGDPTTSPDPGAVSPFTGQTPTTWDARLSALSSFLAGNDMVVYFNHNQLGSDQDLFVWAQIKLHDDQGVLPDLYYYITSTPNGTGLNNFGTPGLNPLAYTGPQTAATCTYPTGTDSGCTFPKGGIGTGTGSGDASFMVQALGHVCLSGPVGVGVPVVCGSAQDSGVSVNENLGANEVANAIVFPEINSILRLPNFGGYDVLNADIRFGCNPATISAAGGCPGGADLNNGFEQIFIGQLTPTITVPEPASLALVGLGLLALGGVGRSRRRKS